jgi:hypothetical protein
VASNRHWVFKPHRHAVDEIQPPTGLALQGGLMGRKKTMSNELKVFARLACALQKLTTSASMHIGADCMLQAKLAQRILQDEGINTRVVVGESAWRVGPGDGDVITHSPRIGGFSPPGVKAVAYHAWLEMGSTIIDFTTHSLRSKAKSLDAMDGGQTNVLWCPAYLVMQSDETVSLQAVVRAPNHGVACYQQLPGLEEMMVAEGCNKDIDEEDVLLLRLIFDSPEMVVIGPNDRANALNGVPA